MLDANPERDGVRAATCMVATGNPHAAEAAITVLSAGGSAVDGAIAADAVHGLVEPMATSVGGDLLAMIVEPDGTPCSYNGTGRSPAALTADRVEALPNHRIPERHPLSLTVPGVVRGWYDLHQRYGRFEWSRLFARAIELAEGGFAVTPICAREWKLFEPVLKTDATSATLFRAGNTPLAGERFVNPELGALLRAIAAGGPDAFYQGAVPEAAERASRSHDGVLAAGDFAAHRGDFSEPLAATFRGLTVLESPPNTHGVAVLDALKALDPLPLAADDPGTTLAAVKAIGAALARARETVTDPAGTVCTVIVDKDGLAITLMTSVFKRFGSGISVPGFGFVLQNRGFGFAAPGHINGVGPGKRAYHTVIPAAALSRGRFHAGFGVVGGAMQPQGHVQMMLRLAAWGEPLQAAIDAPRWRLESDTVLAIESGTPEPIAKALRAAGYTEPAGHGELGGRSDFGGAQFVVRAPDGSLLGGTDKRKDGVARGF